LAELIICSDALQGRQFSLTAGGTFIGREAGGDCDIALLHETVSGRHAIIYQEAISEDWILKDLESTNGTYVDGQRQQEITLHHGMVIWLGDVEVRFEVGAQVAAEPPPESARRSPQVALRVERVEPRHRQRSAPKPARPRDSPAAARPQPDVSPDVSPTVLEELRKGALMLRRGCQGGDDLIEQLEAAIQELDRAVSQSDPERSRSTGARLVEDEGALREVARDMESVLSTFSKTLDYFEKLLERS